MGVCIGNHLCIFTISKTTKVREMASLKKILKKKKYSKIKLRKKETHHLELTAKINGIKGTFILDTGASNSCVGLDLVNRFKLVSQESEVKAAGAGAIDMETRVSENNVLKIGNWKTTKSSLVLFDLVHVNTALTQHDATEVDGIIGADILESGKALIDYDKGILYLKKINEKKLKKLAEKAAKKQGKIARKIARKNEGNLSKVPF